MTSRLRLVPYRRRFGLALSSAAAVAAIAAPSEARAAVTIGEDTSTASTDSFGCNSDPAVVCTYGQFAHPTSSVAAPFDGVVVGWRVRGSSGAGQFALRILRPAGTGSWTGAGTSDPETVTSGTENVFETQLPIKQGDNIGVNVPGGNPITPTIEYRQLTGAQLGVWVPALADGETSPPGTPVDNLTLVLNADIEPDVDCDGFGDETQDPSVTPPGNCPQPPQPEPEPEPGPGPKADGTLTIDANKGKVEKGRKVTLTGQLDVASNESCEPGRQIQIQRRLKSEDDSKFETFKTVQTDATGNYSLRVKVKKTYFYRAVVGETEDCDDEVSNSQKVRVQKKKAAQEA
jgi:hypothetical protein